MQVTTTLLPKSEMKITIELEEKEMAKYSELAVKKLGENLHFPGFRPGHIPPEVVKSKVGKDLIQDNLADIAIPSTYADAVIENKIQVVSKPKIKILNEAPLKYEAIVAILPEIKFKKDPKTIKIKEEKIIVTAKEEEDVIKDLLKGYTEYKASQDPAKAGDRVEINFEGVDEKNNILPGMQSKNHPLVIGEKVFLEDFENNLIGVKAGEKKEFDLTFPKDYHKKEIQNKKVHFKTEVLKVENVLLPKFDEEFITQKLNLKKSLDEFKNDLKKSLETFKKAQEQEHRENAFIDELIKLSEIEIPEALLQDEIDFLLDEVKINLKKKGLPEKQIEEYIKSKEEELRKKYHVTAEKQITLRRALNALLEKEKVEVTEEDLQKEISEIKKNYPETQHAKIESAYEKDGEAKTHLKNKLKIEKLFKIYLP